MDRRTFVKASCVGSASLFLDGLDPKAFGDVTLPQSPPIEVVHGARPAKAPNGMPGLFPGRVVEVHDSNSIVSNRVSQPVVRGMIDRGMKELTGEKSASAAWASRHRGRSGAAGATARRRGRLRRRRAGADRSCRSDGCRRSAAPRRATRTARGRARGR